MEGVNVGKAFGAMMGAWEASCLLNVGYINHTRVYSWDWSLKSFN